VYVCCIIQFCFVLQISKVKNEQLGLLRCKLKDTEKTISSCSKQLEELEANVAEHLVNVEYVKSHVKDHFEKVISSTSVSSTFMA